MNEAPRVLVTRAAAQSAALMDALRSVGLDPILVPAIEIENLRAGRVDAAARCLHTYRWVVITSSNGARAILDAAERVETQLGVPSWAAIGTSTRRVLEAEGIDVAFMPTTADAATLAEELPIMEGDRVLAIRGELAGDTLARTLITRGAHVDDVVAYRTREAPPRSSALLRDAIAIGPLAAIVFTSGSSVRGLASLALDASIDLRGVPAVCIGRETSASAIDAGFEVVAIAATPDPDALAAATRAAVSRQPVEVP